MSRALAYIVHFGLGAVWLLILFAIVWGIGGTGAALLWVVCAVALSIADAFRMSAAADADIWRVTILWWLGSFVSPAVAALRFFRAFTETPKEPMTSARERAEVSMDDAELRRRLTAAERSVAALQRELAELRELAARPEAPVPSPPAESGAEVAWWERQEPEAEAPVRVRGPVEGARGNREVPPATIVREP